MNSIENFTDEDLLRFSNLKSLGVRRWEACLAFNFASYEDMQAEMMSIMKAVVGASRRGFKIETVVRTVYINFDDADDAVVFMTSYAGAYEYMMGAQAVAEFTTGVLYAATRLEGQP